MVYAILLRSLSLSLSLYIYIYIYIYIYAALTKVIYIWAAFWLKYLHIFATAIVQAHINAKNVNADFLDMLAGSHYLEVWRNTILLPIILIFWPCTILSKNVHCNVLKFFYLILQKCWWFCKQKMLMETKQLFTSTLTMHLLYLMHAGGAWWIR